MIDGLSPAVEDSMVHHVIEGTSKQHHNIIIDVWCPTICMIHFLSMLDTRNHCILCEHPAELEHLNFMRNEISYAEELEWKGTHL